MARMQSDYPATCTIELSTGSLVQVAHTPGEVDELRRAALHDPPVWPDSETGESRAKARRWSRLIRLNRQTGRGNNWREVHIDPSHIVAIYPIDTRPERW